MTNPIPLTLDERPLITEFLTRFPPVISEHTFTNLFAWRHARPIWHLQANDSLVFLCESGEGSRAEYILLGPPIGGTSTADMLMLLKDTVCGAVRIPAAEMESLRQAGLVVQEDRANADYVYRVSDLAELAGRNYAKKRNHIKHCLDRYDCAYEEITEANIAECLAMQDKWCEIRQCSHEPSLCGEYHAILETFNNFAEFSLIAGAIRIAGEICAFTVGEQLSPGTAVCHFEKALPGYEGLGQLINQWFAAYGLKTFEYVNREQDLGVDGLRKAKESYHPAHMVDKCIAGFDALPKMRPGGVTCPE